jgi:5,6-dimethylbenzimidazole synthase
MDAPAALPSRRRAISPGRPAAGGLLSGGLRSSPLGVWLGSGMDLYDAVRGRRDVRREFSGEPIEPVVLERVLTAAHCAPSVGLTQPWDFILIDDHEVRRSFQRHVARERDAFDESLTAEQKATFAKIKIEGILESTLGICVTYDSRRGAPAVLGRHTISDTGLYSTCLAIQNLWLAATAENLGVGWVSFYQEPFLRELLDIPGAVRPVAWLCVGPVTELQAIPDLERAGWRTRRHLENAIHINRYREPGSG